MVVPEPDFKLLYMIFRHYYAKSAGVSNFDPYDVSQAMPTCHVLAVATFFPFFREVALISPNLATIIAIAKLLAKTYFGISQKDTMLAAILALIKDAKKPKRHTFDAELLNEFGAGIPTFP